MNDISGEVLITQKNREHSDQQTDHCRGSHQPETMAQSGHTTEIKNRVEQRTGDQEDHRRATRNVGAYHADRKPIGAEHNEARDEREQQNP